MDQEKARKISVEFQATMKTLNALQEKITELRGPTTRLMGQINENEMVKKELELLEDDAAVFKLQGPVLVKQEIADARQNVASRLKYLTGELDRIEKEIKGKHDEMDACQKKLQELSETLKAMQDAAVQAAQQQQQQAKGGKK